MLQRSAISVIALVATTLVPALPAQTGLINTIAGNGTSGMGGVGGLAINAQVSGQGGVAVDSGDNLYIADIPYNRVLRVDAASGILSVVAGNGVAASSGDNGPATQASVNAPYVLAFDSARNLLIVEFQGHRIRRVDALTGIITTIAGNGTPGFSGDGGPAISASLDYPDAIALDTAGNLYIADGGNARIRRVDALSGIITTVAGNGTFAISPDGVPALMATFSQPFAVSVDRSGNLLIPEPGSGRVRRIDAATGILGTVAGNGTADFTGDAVPATSAGIGKMGINVAADSLNNLFFADGTGRIRRVDALTGLITTVAGNGTGAHGQASSAAGAGTGCYSEPLGDNGPASIATLDGAVSVALTSNGNLIFSDWLDCRVRRVYLPSPYPYTNTSVFLSAGTVLVNQPITFTARVSPIGAGGTPTGTIQFVAEAPYTGSSLIGTAQLTNGTASLTITAPPNGGNYMILADYGGDSSNNGSGSPAVPLTISAGTVPVVTVSSSQNPAPVNTPVTLTATVTPPAGLFAQPTGSVEFDDGGSKLGTANLAGSTAQFPVSFATSGTHTITAKYLGDINFAPTTSPALLETVNTVSTVSLATSAASLPFGQQLRLTATVSPNSATGTVNFLDTGTNLSLGTAALSGGAAVLTLSNLPAGTHTIQASYSGDNANAPATSAPLTQSITQATPAITVSSTANPTTVGEFIVFNISFTPVSPGATLSVMDGQTVLSTVTPTSAGAASYTTSSLPAGSHAISVVWAGDANVAAGSSAVLTETVQSSTTVTLAGPTTLTYGQPATFTATVSPSAATGIVQFNDGGTLLGAPTLSGGSASVTVPNLTVGTHLVVATYEGDGVYIPNNTSLSVTVNKVVSSVTLATASNPSTVGTAVTLTATVLPSSATGTVQFLNGATVLGSAVLANGSAQISVANLPVGSNSLTAVYSGDPVNAGSASAAIVQTVAKVASTTALAGPASPLNVGQSATFTATVTPSSATGTIQFLDGAVAIGAVAVNGGTAVFSTTALAAGSHSITAAYSGDGVLNPSTSAAVGVQVVKYATTTSLTNTPNLQVFTGQVSLTATISAPQASGTVQFYNGAALLGSATLVNGQAFLGVSTLNVGVYTLTAVYGGDATFAGSTSPAVQQRIVQAASTTSISAAPAGQSTLGQMVTFTATVAPAAATGSVQFLAGNTAIGTAVLVNGVAMFSTSALKAGNLSITAAYLGDSNVAASTSVKLAYKVKP